MMTPLILKTTPEQKPLLSRFVNQYKLFHPKKQGVRLTFNTKAKYPIGIKAPIFGVNKNPRFHRAESGANENL